MRETSSRTWLAPRNVDAAIVTTKEGESEKYLFYRGVANRQAPLRVSQGDGQIAITSQFPAHLSNLQIGRPRFVGVSGSADQ